MRVRKVLLASLLAIGCVMGGGPAMGAPPEGKGGGPACTDIVGVGGSYSPTPDPRLLVAQWQAVVSPNLTLAAPSCTNRTYTVHILDDALNPAVLASRSVQGDGSPTVDFGDITVSQEAGDTTVCVYATSSIANGRHVIDRQPAVGCAVVEETDEPTEGGWSP